MHLVFFKKKQYNTLFAIQQSMKTLLCDGPIFVNNVYCEFNDDVN